MGSIHIRNFKGGLDARGLPETTPGGALLRAYDCFITQSGAIAQRADFVHVWSAPAGSCVGLAATNDNLVTFGSASADPAGMPSDWLYKQLVHPDGEALIRVPSWTVFGGDLVSAAKFNVNVLDRYLFVDETLVDDSNAPPQADDDGPWAVLTTKSKLTVAAGSTVYFSALRVGDDFTDTGAGFIDMSFEVGDDATVRALAPYEGNTAVFFQKNILIWSFPADPADAVPEQHIGGSGAFSARAVLPFRDGDVLFWDSTGIRSLRARDSSGAAQTVDVGSPIDILTRTAFTAASLVDRELASAVIDPLTGLVWFALGEEIFVLSHFPETKVSAWSIFRPGFRVDAMIVFGNRIYLRSGNDFYVYGGPTGEPLSFEGCAPAEVWLPYLDGDTPATEKHVLGLDVACRGTWEIRLAFDPENLDASDLIARTVGSTYWKPKIGTGGALGSGSHIGLRFLCTGTNDGAAAVLSSALIHHHLDDQQDLS